MDSEEFDENICRICLDENVVLNWNNYILESFDITYKDCYYKYTQLECLDDDPFSSMLCQDCVNGLEETHALILTALQSLKYLKEGNPINLQKDATTSDEDDSKYCPTEFETVLIEEDVLNGQCVNEYPDTECGTNEQILEVCNQTEDNADARQSLPVSNSVLSKDNFILLLSTSTRYQKEQNAKRKSIQQNNDHDDNNKKLKPAESKKLENETVIGKTSGCVSRVESKNKNNERYESKMCSICSKVLRDKRALRMHEKTHMENRERKEACKVCGLKFYNKTSLYAHRRIHNVNREKKHKCEFCDKAFYNRGELNIHQRIHLGQMKPCSLCSKEFFRKIDLEKHMMSHSAKTTDRKTRTRYYVRCKHCDKSILSTSFKSHMAAHLNAPLMKCSLCDKEFFSRGSCVFHMKKIHQKTHEEYNDFIVLYTKNRISRLFLEQNAEIHFPDSK